MGVSCNVFIAFAVKKLVPSPSRKAAGRRVSSSILMLAINLLIAVLLLQGEEKVAADLHLLASTHCYTLLISRLTQGRWAIITLIYCMLTSSFVITTAL